MFQQVKEFAMKHDDLHFMLSIHMKEETSILKLFSDLYMGTMESVHSHTHVNIH